MDYEKAVLVDATVITMVALLIGLLVHAWLRRRNPELGYGLQGNVGTSAFGYADLVVVGALFLLIVARVVYDPGAGDGLDADADAAERLTPEMTWAGIFINMLLLGALFFFVGYMGRRSISEVFGLSRYPVWRVFAVAIGLMVVVVPLVFLAGFVFRRTVLNDVGDSLELQEAVRSLAEQSGFSMRFVLILAACVVAPVVEEFLFRGYFYPVIKRYSDRFFSAVVTSMAFAVVHMNLLSVAPLFVLAMAFTLAYELTGCLWVPIVMHALFNTAQVVMILLLMTGG